MWFYRSPRRLAITIGALVAMLVVGVVVTLTGEEDRRSSTSEGGTSPAGAGEGASADPGGEKGSEGTVDRKAPKKHASESSGAAEGDEKRAEALAEASDRAAGSEVSEAGSRAEGPEGVSARDAGPSADAEEARDAGGTKRRALKSAVEQAVEQVEPELRQCYQKMIDDFPKADGTVATVFEIDSGEKEVGVASINEGTTLFDKKLHECLLGNITKLSVDVPWDQHFADTGALAINYQFHFETASDDESDR